MKISSILSLIAVIALSAATAFAGDVTVKSAGFKGQKGKAIFYLWKPGAEGFPNKTENAAVSQAVAITGDTVTYTFKDVAPGSYAVTITHDENENGKMDTGFMGKPKEGYGASNNPQNKLSAPSFEQCKVDVPAGGKSVDITMRY